MHPPCAVTSNHLHPVKKKKKKNYLETPLVLVDAIRIIKAMLSSYWLDEIIFPLNNKTIHAAQCWCIWCMDWVQMNPHAPPPDEVTG